MTVRKRVMAMESAKMAGDTGETPRAPGLAGAQVALEIGAGVKQWEQAKLTVQPLNGIDRSARLIDSSPTTVRRMMDAGVLPFVMVGLHRKVKGEVIERVQREGIDWPAGKYQPRRNAKGKFSSQ